MIAHTGQRSCTVDLEVYQDGSFRIHGQDLEAAATFFGWSEIVVRRKIQDLWNEAGPREIQQAVTHRRASIVLVEPGTPLLDPNS